MARIKLNLQLFSEVATAASAPAAESVQPAAQAQSGVTDANPARRGRKENPLANVQYGRQASQGQAAAVASQEVTRRPFKELIDGEYKEDFHNHVQGIMQERFRKNDELQKNVDRLRPVLMSLGQRYEVDMTEINESSIASLAEKLNADDDYLEKAAMERGMSKEGYKLFLDVQNREKLLNEREKQTQAQQNYERHIQSLSQQAEAAGIDLRAEMQNPDFMRLTSPQVGVPVAMAYNLIHQKEILENGMQYAAQQGAKRVAQAVQSGQARAVENGMARKGSSVIYKPNPRDLTTKDREEIRRRVRSGDKSISF